GRARRPDEREASRARRPGPAVDAGLLPEGHLSPDPTELPIRADVQQLRRRGGAHPRRATGYRARGLASAAVRALDPGRMGSGARAPRPLRSGRGHARPGRTSRSLVDEARPPPPMSFITVPLIYYPISGILWFWHKILAFLGGLLPWVESPDSNGVIWALSVIFLVVTLRLMLFWPAARQMRFSRKMQ